MILTMLPDDNLKTSNRNAYSPSILPLFSYGLFRKLSFFPSKMGCRTMQVHSCCIVVLPSDHTLQPA